MGSFEDLRTELHMVTCQLSGINGNLRELVEILKKVEFEGKK